MKVTKTATSTVETWGLMFPDGRVIRQGYSQRPLTSAADVIGDFSRSVTEDATPVLLTRTTTTVETFDAPSTKPVR